MYYMKFSTGMLNHYVHVHVMPYNSFSFKRVEKNTSLESEPKFLVFYSMLLSLFSMFCFRCKAGKPKVEMKQTGTMVTVLQYCKYCEGNPFTWRSQPYHPVMGRYPAGNILLSFAVLLAGASISKVLLVFRHMGLCTYSIRTYFAHQKKFVFPSILHHWETYRAALIDQLKVTKDVVWSGDGRFDSMGHSAKYGAYTMFCSTIMKIVHFELLQVKFLQLVEMINLGTYEVPRHPVLGCLKM